MATIPKIEWRTYVKGERVITTRAGGVKAEIVMPADTWMAAALDEQKGEIVAGGFALAIDGSRWQLVLAHPDLIKDNVEFHECDARHFTIVELKKYWEILYAYTYHGGPAPVQQLTRRVSRKQFN